MVKQLSSISQWPWLDMHRRRTVCSVLINLVILLKPNENNKNENCRPVSLIHVDACILSKILANRIQYHVRVFPDETELNKGTIFGLVSGNLLV